MTEKTITEGLIEMIAKVTEMTKAAPTAESHVIILHPIRWYDLLMEGTTFDEGLKRESLGWRILAHDVVGTFRGIPIISSNNAPVHKSHLNSMEDVEANVRRGLVL